ncbi:MAG: ubiquinol-cytochrome C chaperone [Rhodospirillales bacterium]|nr:ubiquinol-cytochrome C chaperone [Rhodospirillales bacterium]
MLLSKLFGRDPFDAGAQRLYVALVGQARHPALYSKLGVPDSLDGRFDSIALHVFLVLNRLKREDDARAAAIAQLVVDAFVEDMDRSVRELGVGDMGVSRRVKQMAQALYGRAAVYEAAAAAEGDEGLCQALARNLYATAAGVDSQVLAAMAGYVRAAVAALASQPLAALVDGKIEFPEPEFSR